jgi:hypothetical protein
MEAEAAIDRSGWSAAARSAHLVELLETQDVSPR